MLEKPTGLWEKDNFFFLLFFLLRNSSSTPDKTSLQHYSTASLPLLAAAKQLQENKGITRAAARREQKPQRGREPGATARPPRSASELSQEGLRGTQGPHTGLPRGGKGGCTGRFREAVQRTWEEKKKERGWREASFCTQGMSGGKAGAAVIIKKGNWRNHIQKQLYSLIFYWLPFFFFFMLLRKSRGWVHKDSKAAFSIHPKCVKRHFCPPFSYIRKLWHCILKTTQLFMKRILNSNGWQIEKRF